MKNSLSISLMDINPSGGVRQTRASVRVLRSYFKTTSVLEILYIPCGNKIAISSRYICAQAKEWEFFPSRFKLIDLNHESPFQLLFHLLPELLLKKKKSRREVKLMCTFSAISLPHIFFSNSPPVVCADEQKCFIHYMQQRIYLVAI